MGKCLGIGVGWNEMGLLEVIYESMHVGEIEATACIIAALEGK